MAFKTVSANKKFYKLEKECEKGQILAEGVYLRETISQKFGGRQFEIRDEKHGIVVLGGGSLAASIDNGIELGDYIRVTYDGMRVMDSGNFKGSKAHRFIVEVDKERSSTPVAADALTTAEDQVAPTATETVEAQNEVAEATKAASQTATEPQSATSDILAKYKKA